MPLDPEPAKETKNEGDSLAHKMKARQGARGWVTREERALRQLIEEIGSQSVTKLHYVKLKEGIASFEKRVATFDRIQLDIEQSLGEEDLDKDINESFVFLSNMKDTKYEAEMIYDQRVEEDNESVHSSANSGQGTSARVKLPRLELPKFDGKYTEWQNFWDQFSALVDKTDMPNINKFSYLQSLVEGEAKTVIQGLSITEKNYHISCKLLQDRYGRNERIVFAHIQALLNLSIHNPNRGGKVSSLWQLQDEVLSHVRSLEALGIDGKEYGVFMTPVVLSRLPNDIRMEWARDGEGKEADLDWLLEFLRREIERRERSETFRTVVTGKPPDTIVKEKRVSTTSALQTGTVDNNLCNFCDKPHASGKCWNILKLPVSERHTNIQTAKLCFRCLGKGHMAKGCTAKCTKCKGKHHVIICMKDSGETKPSMHTHNIPADTNTGNVGVACSPSTNLPTVLQTAKVHVLGECGVVEATLLFDSGSDRSYVSSKLVQKVKPKLVSSEPVSYAAFGSSKANQNKMSNVFDLKLKTETGSGEYLRAVEVPVICSPLLRPSVPGHVIKSLGSDIKLADSYEEGREVSIDILVGLDAYWKFVRPTEFRQVGTLVAQKSSFGWILSGSWAGNSKLNRGPSTQLLCLEQVSDIE